MSVIEYVMFLNVPFMRATKKKKTTQNFCEEISKAY